MVARLRRGEEGDAEEGEGREWGVYACGGCGM